MLTFITHDQKNDNFFKKKRLLHNQTSVVLETKQTSLGSRKKNKSGNPQIDHSVHYILIIDFQYFFKECHTYETTKQKKYSFIFKINHQEGENKKSLWWYME